MNNGNTSSSGSDGGDGDGWGSYFNFAWTLARFPHIQEARHYSPLVFPLLFLL